MRTLNFEINGQNLKKNGDFTGLIIGSSGFLKCHADFSSDWDQCLIAASFWVNEEEYPVILDDNNECLIPDEVTSNKKFSVSFTGVGADHYTITTNKIKVYQGE